MSSRGLGSVTSSVREGLMGIGSSGRRSHMSRGGGGAGTMGSKILKFKQ